MRSRVMSSNKHLISRRAMLAGLLAGSAAFTLSSRALGQALPVEPVVVPYNPVTRVVSLPVAANDNLASAAQRTIANRTLTKAVTGMKAAGVGLTRTNTALRAIGKVLTVARVGGPWGLLISVAGSIALEIALEGGLSYLFGDPEGPGNVSVPPGSNNTTAYMSYPWYSSVLDMPLGVTIVRNSNSSPTGLNAFYRYDYPSSSPTPPSSADGWSRNHIQNSVSAGTNRATYVKAITSGQASAGIVIDVPNDPAILVPGFAEGTGIVNSSAEQMHQALVRKALADDAAANGSNAAFPGYQVGSPLPFTWPQEVPASEPLTVGDWKADWPAAPPEVSPVTKPWVLPQDAWDQVPSIDPGTGTSTQPNPGTDTGADDSTLPIPTGAEVTPDGVADLPAFEEFVNPFNNLFDPFKNALSGGSSSCPTLHIPDIDFTGWAGGKHSGIYNVTKHCDLIEPMRPAIIAAGTAMGAFTAIDNILEA